MREYFKRLKEHPGVVPAAAFHCLFVFAALSNKNIQPNFSTALLIGTIAAAPFWAIVLISNRE